MPITLSQLQALVGAEYSQLTSKLSLNPIPLDIYVITDVKAFSSHNTDTRNATAIYDPTKPLIILPVAAGNLPNGANQAPVFPPQDWRLDEQVWPWWRTEIWHEVVHQYQDQKLNLLDTEDGCKGHCKGWSEAIADIAQLVGATAEQVKAVI